MTTDLDPTSRFHCASREALAAFAAQSPRLADLARTHPVLFVALATGYGTEAQRVAAINAALEGRRLRKVCDLAGIPFCLREVTRELCPVPLPPAEWSCVASPVLAQFVPDDAMTLCNWTPSIFFANGAADEYFALWLAMRHELFTKTFLDYRRLLPIAMYSWFARRPGCELHALMPARWSSRAGSRRLLSATRAWLYRICCRIYLPGSIERRSAPAPHVIGPYHAYELTDYQDLLAEQQAMDNCLDRYGRRIASGAFAIFSLRLPTGERVANFEVGLQGSDGPVVTEFQGRSNEPLAPEVFNPVLQWVATSSTFLRRAPVDQSKLETAAAALFAELVAPYVDSHKEALASYGAVTLFGLETDMAELARRLGITSWPVRFERT